MANKKQKTHIIKKKELNLHMKIVTTILIHHKTNF